MIGEQRQTCCILITNNILCFPKPRKGVKLLAKSRQTRKTRTSKHADLSQPAGVRSENDLHAILDGLKVPPFLLILDNVQDPHNLGACLRSADAAGVHAVIVPKDRAVSLTPAVRSVASGAAEQVPFVAVTNLSRAIDRLKDRKVWVIGAADEAVESLYDTDLSGSLALVMGSEGKGLRRLTREHCDSLVRIPMAGSVESLNVSVAAGICLFEAVRQRSGSA
jgi:23S rRNA (guanosine2251-2'-O)-methyltransferase